MISYFMNIPSQLVLQDDIADLLHLVRFGLIAHRLDVDNFIHTVFSVDEVISLYAALETKAVEDSLKV